MSTRRKEVQKRADVSLLCALNLELRKVQKMKQLEIGQKVTSKYYSLDQDLVRTITTVYKDDKCSSGFRVSANGGEPCKECGRVSAFINNVDGGWFIPID